MEQLINSLVTAGVGLVFLGASYALDLLVGAIKVIFTDQMKWSWKKMVEDLVKALLIAIGTESWVALWYFGTWFAQAIGLNIDEYLNVISIVGVIGAIGGGGFWYLASAGQNLLEFLNTKHVDVQIDESQVESYYRIWFYFLEEGTTEEPAPHTIHPVSHEGLSLIEWGVIL